MYEKYPATMLYNRAMSFLARQLFPDVIRGAGYTFDELKEIAGSYNHMLPVLSEEAKIEIINSEQASELKDILEQCDPTYHVQVISHLRKSSAGIETIEQIPSNLFDRIKNAAVKKAEEYQSKIKANLQEVEDMDYQEAHG